MKKLLKIKTLAICAILLAGIIFPTILTAQRSDGFFKSGDEGLYENRDEYILNDNDLTLGGLSGENPTTVPLGNGLFVLSIAGAGYAVVRRKHSRRDTQRESNGMVLLMALVLLLGMTQCKKREMIAEATHKVFITVDVDCNTAKTGFIPGANGDGSFVWTDGVTEYIEVGHSYVGGHVGTLMGTGNGTETTTFSGTLSLTHDMKKDEILYFFYLGTTDEPREGIGESLTTLHITDQYGAKADVTKYHWAIGSDTCAENGQHTYSAMLKPAMSILSVNLTGFGDETIRMYGDDVYSIATIDYANGTIVGKEVKGGINLGTQGEKYIALIPSSASSTTVKFASATKYADMNFNCGIKAGKFYSNGGSPLPVEAQSAAEPGGALPGLFSVASGKRVKFSQGNLQYQASTDTWRFADHQYDFIGAANSNVSSTYDGWIDLFGWGTSGYHNNRDRYNIYYYPYSTGSITGAAFNCNGYGPTNAGTGNYEEYTQPDLDFTGVSADYDWGIHNAIEHGGNTPGKWRTLTHDEWLWLLGPDRDTVIGGTITPGINCRETHSNDIGDNARFAAAYLFGTHHGIIIFPDDYDHPDGVAVPKGINKYKMTSWNDNQYNVTDWGLMESAGCVFLPAAGYRSSGTTTSFPNARGVYWASTHSPSSTTSAACSYFANGVLYSSYWKKQSATGGGYIYNYSGFAHYIASSVRLVRDAN